MASIDQLRLSETVVEGNKQVSESSEPSVNTDTATPDAALSTPTSNPASTLKAGPLNGNLPSSITDSNGTAISSKPALVQLGSGPNPSAPQPKRFSAVNINKTFLQKTSSSSNAAPAITSSASQKSGGPPGLCLFPSLRRTPNSSITSSASKRPLSAIASSPGHHKAHCRNPSDNYNWPGMVSSFFHHSLARWGPYTPSRHTTFSK